MMNEKKRRDEDKALLDELQEVLEEGGITLEIHERGFVPKATKLRAAILYIRDLQKDQLELKKLRWLIRSLGIPIPLCIIEDWDDYEDSEAESDASSTR